MFIARYINLIHKTTLHFTQNFHVPLKNLSSFKCAIQVFKCTMQKETMRDISGAGKPRCNTYNAIDLVSKLLHLRCAPSTRVLPHMCFYKMCISECALPRDIYFHVCSFTRRVLPRVCCHETCTLHDTSKRGPRKHVTGMHCSIVVIPCKIKHVKMKLQLSGTVYH